MGPSHSLTQDTAPAGAYLVFDHYPFKLAVIQQLMYEFDLLGDQYYGGDQYFETYGDVSNVSERISIHRLAPYIEQGNHFFESLNIPCSLADKVTELYVGEELDVYYHINPQWLDFEDYFDNGADFDITAISERELKQFPNLKSIVFNMYHLPPDALISQLEESGIEVGLFA